MCRKGILTENLTQLFNFQNTKPAKKRMFGVLCDSELFIRKTEGGKKTSKKSILEVIIFRHNKADKVVWKVCYIVGKKEIDINIRNCVFIGPAMSTTSVGVAAAQKAECPSIPTQFHEDRAVYCRPCVKWIMDKVSYEAHTEG
jgi:hypothetical protein